MAFYGPNAGILGGAKLDLWHHEVITDIEPVMKSLLLLGCIDLLSAVTNGILLATTCKINCFKIIQKIQSQYWLIFAFTEARCMFEVHNRRFTTYQRTLAFLVNSSWPSQISIRGCVINIM